jgi:hypothetical protein
MHARLEMMKLQIATKKSMQPQVMMKHEFLFQSQASNAMLDGGSCEQITGGRKYESLCSNPRLQIAMLEWRSCEQITCGKLQSVGCGGGGVSAICPPLHSTHGRKPATITHLFNQIHTHTHIYICINFEVVLFLSSPLPKEKNKQTNKQKFLEKKNNGTTNPTPPNLSLVFGLLFYFTSFMNDVLVDLWKTLFTIFYFY